MMITRAAGSIARQRSFDRETIHEDDEQAWTRLAASSRYRGYHNGQPYRNEDLNCPFVAAILGIGLVLFGASLFWVADLRTTQLAQLKQVQTEQEAWDARFSWRWKATEWELLVNGTKSGKLSPQVKTTQISDRQETFVTSAKKTRLNLLGSVFAATGLEYNTTAEGPQQLTADKLTYPVTISVQVAFEESTGSWEISKRFGGPGCSVHKPEMGLTAGRIPVLQWRNSTPPHLDSKQVYKSEVALFEAHDPYMFVANLTSGSMMLADSSINSAACGIVAIVFGAVLIIPLVLLKAVDLCEAQRRKRLVKFSLLSFDDIPLQQCTIGKC